MYTDVRDSLPQIRGLHELHTRVRQQEFHLLVVSRTALISLEVSRAAIVTVAVVGANYAKFVADSFEVSYCWLWFDYDEGWTRGKKKKNKKQH